MPSPYPSGTHWLTGTVISAGELNSLSINGTDSGLTFTTGATIHADGSGAIRWIHDPECRHCGNPDPGERCRYCGTSHRT